MASHSASIAAAKQQPVRGPRTFLDLLACPACKAPLAWHESGLSCSRCVRVYRMLPDSEVPVLLRDESFTYEPQEHAREMKAQVVERFAMIDRTLHYPYGTFATFLNLGYVADDNVQHAVRGPQQAVFGRFSTKLLFEVLGASDLDGRVTVELSAGRGGNIEMIRRHYDPQTLIGVDLSIANADFCYRRQTLERGGFVVGDAEYLPFRDRATDVVLNIEASHYYPNRARFFDEVYRVLTPGGEFLYADILPAEAFAMAEEHLVRQGFEITRQTDISSNVILSCTAIAKLRERAQATGVYDTFTVVPGSAEFEALSAGRTRYRILSLRKP